MFMQITWKTDFALFNIVCYDVGMMLCFALSGTKGEANTDASGLKCEFCTWNMQDISSKV